MIFNRLDSAIVPVSETTYNETSVEILPEMLPKSGLSKRWSLVKDIFHYIKYSKCHENVVPLQVGFREGPFIAYYIYTFLRVMQ